MASAINGPTIFARRETIAGVMTLTLAGRRGAMAAENTTSGDRTFLAWDMQIEIRQQDMGRLAARRGLTQEIVISATIWSSGIGKHSSACKRWQISSA